MNKLLGVVIANHLLLTYLLRITNIECGFGHPMDSINSSREDTNCVI
jgi:hypothetical protein